MLFTQLSYSPKIRSNSNKIRISVNNLLNKKIGKFLFLPVHFFQLFNFIAFT